MQARPRLDVEGREGFTDECGVGFADLAELVGRMIGNDHAAGARIDRVRAEGLLEALGVDVDGLVGGGVGTGAGERGLPVPVAHVATRAGQHTVALVGVALAEVVGAGILQQVLQADHAAHHRLHFRAGVVVLVVRAQERIQELVDVVAGVAREPAGRVAGGGAVGARGATVGTQVAVGVGRLGENLGALAHQEGAVEVSQTQRGPAASLVSTFLQPGAASGTRRPVPGSNAKSLPGLISPGLRPTPRRWLLR
ncbi:hypothetical protein G6F40_013914 [Rhizopus arrhizus]|nr:hypothetical protein G6F40_013914 [Rhizopus arrhizus]